MYDGWRGTFYPAGLPKSRWFGHYATQFDTVELNGTFYRLPSVTSVERWAAAAPPGFVFSLKLGAFGSHRKKLRDPASWLPRHVETFRPLGGALGPNVVQLPPSWRRNVERLDEMLAVARTCAPATRWAVELRDASWLHDDVFEVLHRHTVALVVHDLLADHPFEMTTDWTYVRFHGPDALRRPYTGGYGERRLRPWVARLAPIAANGLDVFAYFNNDIAGHAVADARLFRDALTAAVESAPRRL
jgi:uncharacterized protein YecE (DUF72 family)